MVVEFEVGGAGGGIGAGVDMVSIVEGVAAGALLEIADNECPVRDVMGEVGVGVQASEVAHEGCSGGVGAKGCQDFVAIGGGVLEI
jgi:hypothetical protein